MSITEPQIPTFEQRHRLGLALEAADVSVAEMAEELGVHRNTVSNYLSGRSAPSRAVVRVWALRCGVPFAWLEHGIIDLHDPDGGSTQPEPSPGCVTGNRLALVA